MLNNLRWNTLSAEILNDPKSDRERRFVEAHINTLHNVVRRVPTSRGAFRQCQAVDIVQKFRDVTEYPVIVFNTSPFSIRRGAKYYNVCMCVSMFYRPRLGMVLVSACLTIHSFSSGLSYS